jgi:hypothetical protein
LGLVLVRDAISEPGPAGIQRAILDAGDEDEGQAFSFKALAGSAAGSGQDFLMEIVVNEKDIVWQCYAARTIGQ